MRTLHYCETFSALSETFVYDYITELEQQGLDNHVVTHRRENEEERPFPKVSAITQPNRWHPRRLWHRVLIPFGFRKEGTSNWPQVRDRLEAVGRRVQPDVIHAHFGPEGAMIAPVAQRLQCPLVVTFYGYDISSLPKQAFWQEEYNRLWGKTDAVTVLSKQMKRAAERVGVASQKVHVLHLSRDLDSFPFRPPERRVENILFVGRLVPKKAPLDAVRAVERANEEGVALQLDIVGDGPKREEIERYVDERGLSESITLHGQCPSEEIPQRMKAADAFLLPSKTAPNGDEEGTPTVLVEAQAIGLPCVSTRHAGIPEMIPEANHEMLVPEGSVGALSDRLQDLADASVDALRSIAVRGREKVETDFNLSRECGRLADIYRTVIK